MTNLTTKDPNLLAASIGQYSSAGQKPTNQDFYGALVPQGSDLYLKGITLAVADGISPSPVSQQAAETCVQALMSDYYCTPDAWRVKTAASKVIAATNSWLYMQNRHARISDAEKGYICTLSALILKGHKAHIFHIGDSRIYRLSNNSLEPMTQDHRVALSAHESYLGRAMGASPQVEIDYHGLALNGGDTFVLTTDGVHEYWNPKAVIELLGKDTSLDNIAEQIGLHALQQGSDDNLTVQVVRIEHLPRGKKASTFTAADLPPVINPPPKEGDEIDGFVIVRPLAQSARSHIFLARSSDGQQVALKFPAISIADDTQHLHHLMLEEWVAARIDNPYVLSTGNFTGKRTALYTISEYLPGQTLRQWLRDNPTPSLEQVRDFIEQITKGLRALHRREMLHQDLRPENIMVMPDGRLKIIDFGSIQIAGVEESSPIENLDNILGTVQYTAPEYFLGYSGTTASDLFSLGVIAYEMLTGQLPFGSKVNHIRNWKDLRKLKYKSALLNRNPPPDWVDYALSQAVHPDPTKRYLNFSQFLMDMKKPSSEFRQLKTRSLIERNPVRFWQGLSALLALTTLALLILNIQTTTVN
ncbi:protein kinase domain-containing protein [Porticoccus sp. GXU_MW_L64]